MKLCLLLLVSAYFSASEAYLPQSPKAPHPLNAPGNFFVDRTCIDCDTCRWMTGSVFNRQDDQSVVFHQPATPEEKDSAIKAMISCPTGSIRTTQPEPSVKEIMSNSFPLAIDEKELPGVYHLGFHDKLTFGAASYLIVREGGNVLIDTARYSKALAERVESLGGGPPAYMIITHRDHVGNQAKWKERFPGLIRIYHELEVDERTPEIEDLLSGEGDWLIDDDIKIMFLPGHTEGSISILYTPQKADSTPVLFSGDTVAYSAGLDTLTGFPRFNWYEKKLQAASLKELREEEFTWVLPGHGRRYRFMNQEVKNGMLEEAARALEGVGGWVD